MPVDEHFGGKVRMLRRVARSSINQFVAMRLEALAADYELRASQTLRTDDAIANGIVRSHPRASGIRGLDKSEI